MATVLIQIGGLVLLLGLVGNVASRFGISPIPLYLLAGLGLGDGGLISLSAGEDFIQFGAELGVILLLLMLGLEYTPNELVTGMRKAAPVGLLDLVLGAGPGAITALILGWGAVGALVMGGVTYMTSSAICAKVLADLGWLGYRETPGVLSVLVIEDLAMAVYLPIVTTVLAGATLLAGSISLAIALAAVALVLVVALRYGRLVEWFVSSPDNEVLLLKVLGLAILVAGLASQFHVSAAVGAFLVGIAVSGPLAEDAAAVLTPLRDLFAAFFFVFFGLHTAVANLLPVAGIAIGLAVVGIGTKLLTGYVVAARGGVGRAGRLRAGVALIPRGEFSIVIAGLAVASGVDFPIATLAAAYVLILAIVGPIAARLTDHAINRRNTAVDVSTSG